MPLKDYLFNQKHDPAGFILLSIILISCLFPLTLSFLPQLTGMIGVVYLFKKRKYEVFKTFDKKLLILTAFPILSICSAIWSITPHDSLIRAIKISAEILMLLPLYFYLTNLPSKSIDYIKTNLMTPLILGGSFIAIELIFNFPISRFFRSEKTEFSTWELNKNVAAYILLIPIALTSKLQTIKLVNPNQLISMACLIIITGLIISNTASQSAQLATIAMIIAAIAMLTIPRIALPLCFGTIIILFSVFPWITTTLYQNFAKETDKVQILKDASTSVRLEIWDFIALRAHEKPITGFGIDTTRAQEFNDYPMIYYWDNDIMHPHNAALQIWIELGGLGNFAVIAVFLTIFFAIKKQLPSNQTLPTILFSGTMIFLLLSWSVWASWLLGLLTLISCLSMSLNKTNLPERSNQ